MAQVAGAVSDKPVSKAHVGHIVFSIGGESLFSADVISFTLIEHESIHHLLEVAVNGIGRNGGTLGLQGSGDGVGGKGISYVFHDEFGDFQENPFVSYFTPEDDVSGKNGIKEAAVNAFDDFFIVGKGGSRKGTDAEVLVERPVPLLRGIAFK